ncbi:MAG: site-2 protease family protein [Myxococcota bacterium]|nr:site-2 protease family protein [Myxococcota bacterium]
MDLSAEDIRWIFVGLFTLIVSVAVHEFGHAIVAYKLGDDTPKRQGRVTLNPIVHADPIGTILLPLVGGIYGAAAGSTGGFGWGKPVQWQPHRIRKGIKMSTASILVSVAGPGMNLLLGTVLALTHVLLVKFEVLAPASEVHLILKFAVVTNFVLMFFNLLPVPPLDGGHVAQALVPYKHRASFESFAKFGPFIILGVILIPQFRMLFLTPANWCADSIYKGFGALLLW